jgi:hypothetical protein
MTPAKVWWPSEVSGLMWCCKTLGEAHGFHGCEVQYRSLPSEPRQQCFVSIPIPFIRSETSSQFRRFPSIQRLKCTIPHAIHFIIFKSRYYRVEHDAFIVDLVSLNSGIKLVRIAEISVRILPFCRTDISTLQIYPPLSYENRNYERSRNYETFQTLCQQHLVYLWVAKREKLVEL